MLPSPAGTRRAHPGRAAGGSTSEPTESRRRINGVDLCLFEWPGEGPPLLFVHGSSMHARCWDQTIRRLPGRHAYAVDMRGHGRSTVHDPPYPWSQYGEDVAALARALDLRGAVGIGHSMGGHSVTLAAALEPQRFATLVLVDAVISDGQAQPGGEMPERVASPRRRSRFASPDEMIERYRERFPFSSWDADALRDYCTHGLLPAPDGDGFVLACPPEIEGEVYAGARGADIFDEIATVRAVVRVLRARDPRAGDPPFASSTSVRDLATRFRSAAYTEDFHLPDNGHHIPMESPAVVARHVEQVAARVPRGRR